MHKICNEGVVFEDSYRAGDQYWYGCWLRGERPAPEYIKICEDWIKAHCKPTSSVRRRACGHTLKVLVEHDIAYVTTGAFMQAAVNLGYTLKPTSNCGACFNMVFDEETLKKHYTADRGWCSNGSSSEVVYVDTTEEPNPKLEAFIQEYSHKSSEYGRCSMKLAQWLREVNSSYKEQLCDPHTHQVVNMP